MQMFCMQFVRILLMQILVVIFAYSIACLISSLIVLLTKTKEEYLSLPDEW